MPILRNYCEVTYYTCMRCQQKWPIEDMSWDNGLLVCNYRCKDVSVNGALEFGWAKEASRDRQELVPDEKLIHPVDPRTQIETLPASSGTYGK
jgi:hypothetical protein